MLSTERVSGTVELTLPSKTSSHGDDSADSYYIGFAVFCGTWRAHQWQRVQCALLHSHLRTCAPRQGITTRRARAGTDDFYAVIVDYGLDPGPGSSDRSDVDTRSPPFGRFRTRSLAVDSLPEVFSR